MCRLLVVRDVAEFEPGPVLRQFAQAARASREYQGDGWGCARWAGDDWDCYRTVTPIWEDRLDRFGGTRLLVAHARSAFRNEGIVVENNMPFLRDGWIFAFNGELRGVRVTAEGQTGAAKLFSFLQRIGGQRSAEALSRGLDVVTRRTRFVRAMNVIVSDGTDVLVASRFGEDPEYFTLHRASRGTRQLVASDPIDAGTDWTGIPNGSVVVVE